MKTFREEIKGLSLGLKEGVIPDREIEETARKYNVDTSKFLKFWKTRFPNNGDGIYCADWAKRIAFGKAFALADSKSRDALQSAGFEESIHKELLKVVTDLKGVRKKIELEISGNYAWDKYGNTYTRDDNNWRQSESFKEEFKVGDKFEDNTGVYTISQVKDDEFKLKQGNETFWISTKDLKKMHQVKKESIKKEGMKSDQAVEEVFEVYDELGDTSGARKGISHGTVSGAGYDGQWEQFLFDRTPSSKMKNEINSSLKKHGIRKIKWVANDILEFRD